MSASLLAFDHLTRLGEICLARLARPPDNPVVIFVLLSASFLSRNVDTVLRRVEHFLS